MRSILVYCITDLKSCEAVIKQLRNNRALHYYYITVPDNVFDTIWDQKYGSFPRNQCIIIDDVHIHREKP